MEDRLEMVKLAISGKPHFSLQPYEVERIRFPIPMKQWNISKTLSQRGSSSIL